MQANLSATEQNVRPNLPEAGIAPMREPIQDGCSRIQSQPIERPVARQITINPLNHGFHVIVGCQSFAVETIDALLHRLAVYLKDPADTEKKWMTGEWKW